MKPCNISGIYVSPNLQSRSHNTNDCVNGENIIYNLLVNISFIQMDKTKTKYKIFNY